MSMKKVGLSYCFVRVFDISRKLGKFQVVTSFRKNEYDF